MITFRKKGHGEIANFNLLEMLQRHFHARQAAIVQAFLDGKHIKTLETDRQSIDARLNDRRLTADEARHKTTHKMMHDLHIL